MKRLAKLLATTFMTLFVVYAFAYTGLAVASLVSSCATPRGDCSKPHVATPGVACTPPLELFLMTDHVAVCRCPEVRR